MDKDSVYKALQKQIKAYTGPIEFSVVKSEYDICFFSDRGTYVPVRIDNSGNPWTWRTVFAEEKDQSEEAYAKFIFEGLLKQTLKHGSKVNLPARKKIIQSKQMPELRKRLPELDDNLISKYVQYMYVSKQTCKHCEIGEVDVEVGSYAEYHKCINCGYSSTIS